MVLETTGRNLSPSQARSEVHETILRVAHNLSGRRSFGYHRPEDMAQEGYIEAESVLAKDKYDFERPLANFLFISIRNRLDKIKRSQYCRTEPPCKCCDRFDPPAEPCRKFLNWRRTNLSKQRIMSPSSFNPDANFPASSPTPEDSAAFNELDAYILERLPEEFREDYISLKKETLTGKRLGTLVGVLRTLLEGSPYAPAQED